MSTHHLSTPLSAEDVAALRVGDTVFLSGTVYTARDAAHQRLMALLRAGEPLPFPIVGAALYYVGPTPAPPGRVVGSAGPTTSGRMDAHTPPLLDAGLKAVIGKGPRNAEVKDSLKKNGAVYLAAVGGAAVVMAQSITAMRVIAFPELGTEAVRELTVTDFPCIVAIDAHGGDLYEEGVRAYAR